MSTKVMDVYFTIIAYLHMLTAIFTNDNIVVYSSVSLAALSAQILPYRTKEL